MTRFLNMTEQIQDMTKSIFSDEHDAKKQDQINDLLGLSSLMSFHLKSDEKISSENHLIHSKFERLFNFLLTDVYNEPTNQILGEQISNLTEIEQAMMKLNRNATLKFRNYKQFREQLLASSNERRTTMTTNRQSKLHSTSQTNCLYVSRSSLKYLAHWLLSSSIFKSFISIIICLDAISVAITVEYSSQKDSQSLIYNFAVFVNRCILFVYLFETILKWIDHFTNFWYSPVNVLEFILTVISLANLISEIYIDTRKGTNLKINRKFFSNFRSIDAYQRIRSYGSLLSLLRTLRMLRILRILEIAYRFTEVRIVFLALSRSVKLIFHVVLLTIVLNYFFALIALYLTQFGLNTTSSSDMIKINSLFGTVPRAFITVFRLFTKDEWFEIKSQMYSLKIHPLIVDIYILSWLFFGGYVLNPLLVGAMVGTFDETRKEITKDIKQIFSKTRLSFNETRLRKSQLITSSFLDHLDSFDNNDERLDDWIRLTNDELRLLVHDRIDIQWPIYTIFSYLQLLEIFFENLTERQILFEYFSMYFLSLHDKETKSFDPPILSSSSSSSDDDEISL